MSIPSLCLSAWLLCVAFRREESGGTSRTYTKVQVVLSCFVLFVCLPLYSNVSFVAVALALLLAGCSAHAARARCFCFSVRRRYRSLLLFAASLPSLLPSRPLPFGESLQAAQQNSFPHLRSLAICWSTLKPSTSAGESLRPAPVPIFNNGTSHSGIHAFQHCIIERLPAPALASLYTSRRTHPRDERISNPEKKEKRQTNKGHLSTPAPLHSPPPSLKRPAPLYIPPNPVPGAALLSTFPPQLNLICNLQSALCTFTTAQQPPTPPHSPHLTFPSTPPPNWALSSTVSEPFPHLQFSQRLS
ncbi:hypothetical protein DFJ77DRAFT_254092 [Powellomyces hirtus]|nr:hypothetical protein DFJ77DRAFT_254092 [Powellomyces hirtus]